MTSPAHGTNKRRSEMPREAGCEKAGEPLLEGYMDSNSPNRDSSPTQSPLVSRKPQQMAYDFCRPESSSPALHDAHCHRLPHDLCQHVTQAGWHVLNGTCSSDWAMVAETALGHPTAVIPCFGIHPWFADDSLSTEQLASLESMLCGFPHAAVGEIGLDFARKNVPRPLQVSTFRAQLLLAAQLGRPACIHCVRAWGTLAEILESLPTSPSGFLLHSFQAAPNLIERFASAGAYFGFHANRSKPASYPGLFKNIPPERILVETDRNPDGDADAPLAQTYLLLADLLGLELADLAAQVDLNFRRLFAPCLPADSATTCHLSR